MSKTLALHSYPMPTTCWLYTAIPHPFQSRETSRHRTPRVPHIKLKHKHTTHNTYKGLGHRLGVFTRRPLSFSRIASSRRAPRLFQRSLSLQRLTQHGSTCTPRLPRGFPHIRRRSGTCRHSSSSRSCRSRAAARTKSTCRRSRSPAIDRRGMEVSVSEVFLRGR